MRAAKLGIASCLFSQGELDKAADAFVAYARDYPADVSATVAIVQAGNVRLEQRRLDEADALYDRAQAEADANAVDAYLWLSWQALGKGRVLTERARYADAVPYLLSAVRKASEPRVTELARESLKRCEDGLIAAGQTAGALALPDDAILAAVRRRMDDEDFAAAGRILAEALDSMTAPLAIQEARQLLANCRRGQERLGWIRLAKQYSDSFRFAKAADAWKMVAELETRPNRRGDALVSRGNLLRAAGAYTAARAVLGIILTDPEINADRQLFEKARVETMLCFYDEGSFKEALAVCRQILDGPDDTYKEFVRKIAARIEEKGVGL